MADRYADRIGAIDRAAHAAWATLVVPIRVGTTVMVGATLVALALIGWAYALEGLAAVVVFYTGFGGLLVTTHGLAHLVVGKLFGMRFTSWFIGELKQPQPGVKVDYSSYLRTPASRRAWMHSAGALTTKVLPFLLIGSAAAAGLPAWAVWLLPVIGAGTIITDALWSTKSSDWKKFKREMEFAQPS